MPSLLSCSPNHAPALTVSILRCDGPAGAAIDRSSRAAATPKACRRPTVNCQDTCGSLPMLQLIAAKNALDNGSREMANCSLRSYRPGQRSLLLVRAEALPSGCRRFRLGYPRRATVTLPTKPVRHSV